MNAAFSIPFALTFVIFQSTVGTAPRSGPTVDPVGAQAIGVVAARSSIKGAVPARQAHVLNAAVIAPARATTAALPASGTVILPNVPQYYQLPLSCEETSLSMALAHQGLHVSTKQILAVLGVDTTPIVLRNGHILSWGDPDTGFVGNVYGWASRAPWGFFAYPKALVGVIQHFHGTVIAWSEPGVGPNTITAANIFDAVAAGHPVVAYVTWDWRHHPVYYYTDEHGKRIPNFYPSFGHAVTVYGLSRTSVLIRDPYRGTYWISRSAFAASYELGLAIVLK